MHNENSENHGGVTISCAYGYALSSDYDEITMKGLLAQADKKMYEKKAQMKAKDTYID